MAKKKLLSEAQVRKFMGLANLDANVASNFLSENWGMNEEDDEDFKGDPSETDPGKLDYEGEGEEMPVADLEGGEPEETDEATPDVDMDTEALQKIADALGILGTELSPLMSAAGISAEEPEMEMGDEMPPMDMDAEMPPMDMDMDVEAEEEVELEEKKKQKRNDKENESLGMRTGKEADKEQSDKDRREDSYGKWGTRNEAKIVAEVTRRVAKRINEAARAQKKANRLLGRSKK